MDRFLFKSILTKKIIEEIKGNYDFSARELWKFVTQIENKVKWNLNVENLREKHKNTERIKNKLIA